MPLKIYALTDKPHDFPLTKTDANFDECKFMLDFARPLERVRWLGIVNEWVGPTVALHVPVVHRDEAEGGFVVSVRRGEPYFADIPKLWTQHRSSKRNIPKTIIDGIQLVVDFAAHFTEDAQ